MIVIDFMKMWFMGYWRVYLIFYLLGIQSGITPAAVIVSYLATLLMRFILGINIKAFPVIRLIFRKDVFEVVRSWPLSWFGIGNKYKVASKPYRAGGYPRASTAKVTVKAPVKTYQNFNESAFSPHRLKSLPIPTALNMYGTPGAGLESSGFSNTNISLGRKGEENFAKALAIHQFIEGHRLIDYLETYWSVGMPSEYNPKVVDSTYETDIDCVVIAGTTVYLIDLKFYESGGAQYSSYGNTLLINGKTQKTVVMTRNMEMAEDRFKRSFPGMTIKSRVVFIPTSDQPAVLNNVIWPGNIPAVNLSAMLSELSDKIYDKTGRDPDLVGEAAFNLLKS